MRFVAFHLMPYTRLAPDYEGPAWVTCPNRLYDPTLGHELYNTYLDQLVAAEELGFDGVCVNEHHAIRYGAVEIPSADAALIAGVLDAEPKTSPPKTVQPFHHADRAEIDRHWACRRFADDDYAARLTLIHTPGRCLPGRSCSSSSRSRTSEAKHGTGGLTCRIA